MYSFVRTHELYIIVIVPFFVFYSIENRPISVGVSVSGRLLASMG